MRVILPNLQIGVGLKKQEEINQWTHIHNDSLNALEFPKTYLILTDIRKHSQGIEFVTIG